jgi:ABC-type Na+ efflux pump permease subunit
MEDYNKTPNISGAQGSSQGDASSTGPTPEEYQSQAGQTGQSQASQAQPGQELLDELTQLADKFASVVKTAWNSEQRKQVENDVRSGLGTMAVSIEESFKQVASTNEAKDLQTKASEVGEKVTSSKFFADMTSALTAGLRTLSDQLDKVAVDIQTKNAQTGAAKSTTPPTSGAGDTDAAKDIPISKE